MIQTPQWEKIEKELKFFGSNEAKIRYLNELLREFETKLDQETKMKIYEKMVELCIKERWFGPAEKIAEEMGEEGNKYLPKILEGYLKESVYYVHDAERIAKKMGKEGEKYLPKIKKGYKKLLAEYIKNKDWKNAKIIAEEKLEPRNKKDLEILAKIYEHTDPEKALKIWKILKEKKFSLFSFLRRFWQFLGKGIVKRAEG